MAFARSQDSSAASTSTTRSLPDERVPVSQQKSRLCSLAGEIRNKIYKLVLQPCYPSCGGLIYIKDADESRYPFSHTTLLRTCRFIYNDTRTLPGHYAFFVFGYSQDPQVFRAHAPFSLSNLATRRQIWRFRQQQLGRFEEEQWDSAFYCNYSIVKMPEQNRPSMIQEARFYCSELSDIAALSRRNIRPPTLRVTMVVDPENFKDTLNVTKEWGYPELHELVVYIESNDEAGLDAIVAAAPAQIHVSDAKSLSLMVRFDGDTGKHGKCIKVLDIPSKTIVWQAKVET